MSKRLKPVHPGEVLREEYLAPLKLSMNKLALDLRVPATRIAEIVHERRGITPDTALRLGRYFNTTAQFWMNLQTTYDLEMAQDTQLQRINREVQPAPASRRAESSHGVEPASDFKKLAKRLKIKAALIAP